MSFIDTLEKSLDQQLMMNQASKFKQGLNKNTDYSIIQAQVNDFVQYVRGKQIVEQMRQADKQGISARVDTRQAKQALNEIQDLLNGLGK